MSAAAFNYQVYCMTQRGAAAPVTARFDPWFLAGRSPAQFGCPSQKRQRAHCRAGRWQEATATATTAEETSEATATATTEETSDTFLQRLQKHTERIRRLPAAAAGAARLGRRRSTLLLLRGELVTPIY
jgi:hypothetical protein